MAALEKRSLKAKAKCKDCNNTFFSLTEELRLQKHNPVVLGSVSVSVSVSFFFFFCIASRFLISSSVTRRSDITPINH